MEPVWEMLLDHVILGVRFLQDILHVMLCDEEAWFTYIVLLKRKRFYVPRRQAIVASQRFSAYQAKRALLTIENFATNIKWPTFC